ncbi:carbohydrate deacetylase isoform X2 [Falco biarmicus]|uniref:carbohydrate deacetylase isoform X2 n=1 Tax=Falco cherrug TaxID=345164 RepID=UPI000FFB9714|nr:carbohydrate deacetylase isoform X2 [Falco cherrug]XP_037231259.1 carbohydrate deacetylase isoform X2 [Falco rusticolus]XP_056182742.1 carbohydrate deacetylase isoform X2 [Falco biarmicus]
MLQVKLIVTGDDFGYCPRRNQGIVDCFLAGAVSNVSLLVNGSAAADAAKLARRHNIPIGLHANLSEGSPVCEVLKKNSSLLNQDGFFHGKMGFRTALSKGLLNMSEVKQELKAQVELFHELTGHLPPHMDGHQHIHVLPEVRHVFAEVLEEYGIKYTRVPIEPGLQNCDWIPPSLMDFYLGVEEDSFNTVDVFTRHGISQSTWTALKQPVSEGEKGTATHTAVHQESVTLLLRQFYNRDSAGEFSGNPACSRAPRATEGAGLVSVYL